MTMIIKKRCKYDSCLNTVTNSAQFITFHVRRRDKIRFFTYIGCECQHIFKLYMYHTWKCPRVFSSKAQNKFDLVYYKYMKLYWVYYLKIWTVNNISWAFQNWLWSDLYEIYVLLIFIQWIMNINCLFLLALCLSVLWLILIFFFTYI